MATQFEYLESLGYVGSLSDKENAYYNDLISGTWVDPGTTILIEDVTSPGLYHMSTG